MSNLPSLPSSLPGGLPSSLPGGLPSSLPSLPTSLPSNLGSGGSLPASIPGSSLIGNPIPGNYRAQVAQGQALFQAAQNVASGTPGSIATLLQGAATIASNNMSAGLPKTLIMDAAGIAAGFAMGGPVGGAVGVASAALSFVTSVFSGTGTVQWEGFETQPSDASSRNWSLIQNYIANLVESSESGYPPGWYLAYYAAATARKYSLADLTDLFLLRVASLSPSGGDPVALAYLAELGTNGTLADLRISSGYNGDRSVSDFVKDLPWKDPCGWTWPGFAASGNVLQKNYPKPSDSFFKAVMMTGANTAEPPPMISLAYLWGAPTGTGLPGSLAKGVTGVVEPGTSTTSYGGPLDAKAIWSDALADMSDKPRMPRLSIAKRAMSLMPRNIWFDPSLYQLTAIIDNSTQFTALYNLDILNALATILMMSATGAHPRAITTELLVQQANVYQMGGPTPGEQNLSTAYRRFMDEWLNISQGLPPDNHQAVLGQMSSDAPPEALASHAQNLSTLEQWVTHYLG